MRFAPALLRNQPATPEHLDAEAQVTPQDLAAAQEFWMHWGTPLLNAMLNAEAEPEKQRRCDQPTSR